MQYIKSEDYKRGSEDLANAIITELKQGKKVLWFLTGGSSIPSCVETLNILKDSDLDLKNVTVTLTDERYGEVGHPDSSWKKLTDAGFDFSSVKSISPLKGLALDETVEIYRKEIKDAFDTNDSIIASFGVGADVHIAGLLPESEGVKMSDDVISYQGPDFMRISLGLNGIRKIQKAFVFMFGESKNKALTSLRCGGINPEMEPAQILHELKEVRVYSDQIKDKLVTTFIFDCFGVICSSVYSTWYRENMDAHELVDPSFLEKCSQFDIGDLSEDAFVEYLLDFKKTITKEELLKEVDANLKFNTPLANVIKKLRTNGFKIVLLSNAGNDFFERKVYVDFPEFKSLFDEIIISSTVQMVKPDRNIYEYTLKKIGSKPEESIFIDDRKINVDAAEDLGIRGYVYTDVDSFVKYLEVNKFL